MPVNVITPPDDEPFTLEEAKEHLRVTSTHEDNLISGQIATAREEAEGYTRRSLLTQTLELTLDRFPRLIEVPRPPLQSVTSIIYIDTAGASQTLDGSLYDVDVDSTPGRIAPSYGNSWPVTRAVMNAVRVRYVAGYGATSESIPGSIRSAMLLFIGELFARREENIIGTSVAPLPMGSKQLLASYRLPGFD